MRVVVCGGGTAVCIVAARLSEERDVDVVLVEAGPHTERGCERTHPQACVASVA